MDDDGEYRCRESDGEDKEFIKKRYAGKTVEELNAEFEKLKNEFLEAHKELQQKLNSQPKSKFYEKQVDFCQQKWCYEYNFKFSCTWKGNVMLF